jgi:hypothetical protein
VIDAVPARYVRRLPADDRHRLFWRYRRRRRYELRQEGQPIRYLSLADLDELLDGRRYPADFWPVVHAADAAFLAGDHLTWIDVLSAGRRSFPY